MKPFRVIGANYAGIYIPIELPFDSNGDWAFDEDGKPIRGRKPVVLKLPRFEFIPRETHRAMVKALAEAQHNIGEDTTANDHAHATFMASIGAFVDEHLKELLSQRSLGELEQITAHWQEQSQISLGEFLASNGSSTSTRRPSNPTSSTSGSASATSASA